MRKRYIFYIKAQLFLLIWWDKWIVQISYHFSSYDKIFVHTIMTSNHLLWQAKKMKFEMWEICLKNDRFWWRHSSEMVIYMLFVDETIKIYSFVLMYDETKTAIKQSWQVIKEARSHDIRNTILYKVSATNLPLQ
jgi:hypothetical protein